VLVNDRSGVLATAGVWITPTTYIVHYPLLPK
jgi:hypothetical protein